MSTLFHMHIAIVGRGGVGHGALSASAYASGSKTKSVVSSVAYAAGERMKNDNDGRTFDYTSKSEVVYSEILLPSNAPKSYEDRNILWNAAEKAEKRADSQLARTIECAFPLQFTLDECKEVGHTFADLLRNDGRCVDWSIHWKEGNPHMHVVTTLRPIGEDGRFLPKQRSEFVLDDEGNRIPMLDKNGKQKVRIREGKSPEPMWLRKSVRLCDWDDRSQVERLRKAWADICNERLPDAEKMDYRSYKRQGIDRVPTVHEGWEARRIERDGGISDRCETNRTIIEMNILKERIATDEKELEALREDRDAYDDTTQYESVPVPYGAELKVAADGIAGVINNMVYVTEKVSKRRKRRR